MNSALSFFHCLVSVFFLVYKHNEDKQADFHMTFTFHHHTIKVVIPETYRASFYTEYASERNFSVLLNNWKSAIIRLFVSFRKVSEFWLSGKRSKKPREYWAMKTPTTVFFPHTLFIQIHINEAPGINLFPRAFSLAYGKGPGYEVGVGYGIGSISSRFVNQRSLPHTTWEEDK